MKRYNAVAWKEERGTIPPGTQVETAVPARVASFTADLVVPLGQAVVTGAFVAGLATFAADRLGYDGDLVVWFLGWALAVSGLAWVVLLREHRRLLWVLERATGADLDRNGHVGKPAERVVIVNAGSGQREQGRREEEQRRSDFASFVAGLDVRGTALREWERDIGREKYQEFRDVLIRCGWARWVSVKRDGTPNEKQGWELTKPVSEILDRVSG